MMKISAVLLNYTSRNMLQKALGSLSLLGDRLAEAYVVSETLREEEIEFYIKSMKVVFVKLSNSDLGTAIHHVLQGVKSAYTLFLYDRDVLTDEIQRISLHMGDEHTVLAHRYDVQGISVARPFLIKTARLQKGPRFFTSEQVPFAEAVLPAWLAQLEESEVVTLPKSVLKQVFSTHRINDRYMADMVKQFCPRSVNRLKGYQPVPTLTVLISAYNMGKYVETALASLATQNELADQILLMDDGSTDDTAHRLVLWQKNNNLTVFRKENGGKARALNDLLPHVTSEYVMELDADDWLDPNALAVIRNLLRSMLAEVDLLYGNWRIWKQHASGRLWCKGIKQGKQISDPAELMHYPLPLGPRIYRTSSLRKADGFPVSNFAEGKLYEDVLLLRKLMNQGRILYRDFTVYHVREHRQSITKQNQHLWSEFRKNWSDE